MTRATLGLRRLIAVSAIIFGLGLAVFGNWWAPFALAWLPETSLGSWLELIVPFLPMVFIGLGALILTSGQPQRDS